MSVSRYNESLIIVARGLYRRGADDATVASVLGIALRTLKNWVQDHPQFAEARRESKASADAQVENALFEKAISGNTTAMIFWLCNRDPEHWKSLTRVEMSGPDGGAINFTDTAKDVRERLSGKLAGIAATGAAAGVSQQPD